MKLDVIYAGHVQPWLKDLLTRNPTGAARFVADFAAAVAADKVECCNCEDEFLRRVETLCALAKCQFEKSVAVSVFKGYVEPGEYAIALRKTWQAGQGRTPENAKKGAPK